MMAGSSCGLAGTLLLLLSERAAAVMAGEGPGPVRMQVARTKITTRGSSYYWPEARGHPEQYGVSALAAPRHLPDSLAWQWSAPEGSGGSLNGLVMDGEGRLFLAATDGVRAFGPGGALLWQHPLRTSRLPCLADGTLYVTDDGGSLVALSMETGALLWSRRYTRALGGGVSGLGVSEGVVVAASRGHPGGGASHVAGLDAADGRTLWEHRADAQLWSFMPVFTDFGTVVFQDQIGGVYNLHVANGTRLWKAGYSGDSSDHFTDGMATYGGNGLVYAVHSDGAALSATQTSNLRAYDARDGRLVWQREFPVPANSQPLVGRLGRGAGVSRTLSVVVALGAQPTGAPPAGAGYGSGVRALDAQTGASQWEWKPPAYRGAYAAGDQRRRDSGRALCLPGPYGSPSLDARGTLYLGHFNGMVYAIRDDDGDGAIDGRAEVSSFDAGSGFRAGGAAIGPGTLAIPSCDALLVFRE